MRPAFGLQRAVVRKCRVPRRLLYQLISLFLAALVPAGAVLVLSKRFFYEASMNVSLYSETEDSAARLLAGVLLGGAAASSVAFFVVAIRAFRSRKTLSGPRCSSLDLTGVAIIAAISYLGTFSLFFSIDGSFTRLGGTTPYCYARPGFQMYEPLVRVARRLGFRGGNRYLAYDSAWGAAVDEALARGERITAESRATLEARAGEIYRDR